MNIWSQILGSNSIFQRPENLLLNSTLCIISAPFLCFPFGNVKLFKEDAWKECFPPATHSQSRDLRGTEVIHLEKIKATLLKGPWIYLLLHIYKVEFSDKWFWNTCSKFLISSVSLAFLSLCKDSDGSRVNATSWFVFPLLQ